MARWRGKATALEIAPRPTKGAPSHANLIAFRGNMSTQIARHIRLRVRTCAILPPERGLTMETDRLWTAEETADYLRIPKATLYQWHYLGIGPRPGRVGRYLRYNPQDVIRWFRKQQEHEDERS